MNLPERILFIGAHCDDVELIAGGLLARACFARRRVGVLVFSDHRGVIERGGSRSRAQRVPRQHALDRAASRAPRCATTPARCCPPAAARSNPSAARSTPRWRRLRDEYDLVVTQSADRHQPGPPPGGGGGGAGVQGARDAARRRVPQQRPRRLHAAGLRRAVRARGRRQGAHGVALPLAGFRRPAVHRRRTSSARWRGCAARRSASRRPRPSWSSAASWCGRAG